MGLLLQSDALRVLPLHERLACSYADAKPLQRKPWLCCSTKAARKCALLRRVKCTLDDAVDPPIQHPQYYTYDDPVSGEPGPAFSSSRTNLPDKPFWSEDVPRIMRRSRATVPKQSSSKPKGKPGSRRRKPAGAPTEPAIKASQQSVQVFEQKEEEDEDEYRDEYVTYKDPDEKEPEKEPVKDLTPLPDEKLWYNWRKIPPEKEPWHDFSRPPSDNFAVMAAAAAKTGQIKLFGEKPTVTETTLARARKHALKKERLEMEKRRREEIGGLAYYREWVKAWKKDTSKEAVKKHYKETGEDESVQLIKMFQHQTFAEYRTMMGTDPRIQRDPLAIRMTLEQKKAVWGGDPVYPTVNYYQDPNQKIDYRGPNFHEPTVSLFESLRKAGRLITREQLKKIHEEEAASQYAMERDFEDAIAGAVDIGEKEEDEKEGEGEEGAEQEGEEKEEEGEEEEEQQQEGEGESKGKGDGEREGGGGEEEGEGKGEEASTSASTSEQNNEDG